MHELRVLLRESLRTLGPGTRALVLQDPDRQYVGTVLQVLSTPEEGDFFHAPTGEWRSGPMCLIEYHDGETGYLPPAWLLPLPPDDHKDTCPLLAVIPA